MELFRLSYRVSHSEWPCLQCLSFICDETWLHILYVCRNRILRTKFQQILRAQFKGAFVSSVVCVVCPLFVMRLVHTSYIYAQTVYYTQECTEYCSNIYCRAVPCILHLNVQYIGLATGWQELCHEVSFLLGCTPRYYGTKHTQTPPCFWLVYLLPHIYVKKFIVKCIDLWVQCISQLHLYWCSYILIYSYIDQLILVLIYTHILIFRSILIYKSVSTMHQPNNQNQRRRCNKNIVVNTIFKKSKFDWWLSMTLLLWI